jgi:SHS2 domain-containing protein
MVYELFEHTADLGLRVRAASLPELFAEAGRALFAAIVVNLQAVRPLQPVALHVAGDAPELLLFDWLTELLYVFESRRLLLAEFDVMLDPKGLRATCRGEPVDRARHELDHEVKAITYHGLRVEQANEGWLAEVIVDI